MIDRFKPYLVGIIATLVVLLMGAYVAFIAKSPINLQLWMMGIVIVGWTVTAFLVKKYPLAVVGLVMAAVILFTP